MSSSGAALDGLLREVAREAVAEREDAFRRDIRMILAEELARVGAPARPADVGYVAVRAAAKLVQVHESTIRNWIKEGKLKSYQPEPRILRVRVDELHALMAGTPNGDDGEVIDFDARVRALTSRAAKCGSKK